MLATIQGNVAITRQELAEYLITRYGGESVELLVNRKIIENACKANGIAVSDDEIETAYLEELKRLNVDEKKFVQEFLFPNGKSLFEWKEDLLRPKLQMTKLAREKTTVTEDDLRKAFEALYGEKVQGRLILWKPEEKRFALTQYGQIRDSDEAFNAAAHRQFNPGLAAIDGKVPPSPGTPPAWRSSKDEAFKLQVGEVTSLVDLPEGCAHLQTRRASAAAVAGHVGSETRRADADRDRAQDSGVDPGRVRRSAPGGGAEVVDQGSESTGGPERFGAARAEPHGTARRPEAEDQLILRQPLPPRLAASFCEAAAPRLAEARG